jgi:hypothetical protein
VESNPQTIVCQLNSSDPFSAPQYAIIAAYHIPYPLGPPGLNKLDFAGHRCDVLDPETEEYIGFHYTLDTLSGNNYLPLQPWDFGPVYHAQFDCVCNRPPERTNVSA